MSNHTLYRMFSTDGELLYVGLTMRPLNRLRSHQKSKQWWTDIDTIRLEHFDTLAQVQQAERTAITTESPRYNIVLSGLPRVRTYSLEQVCESLFQNTNHSNMKWLRLQIKQGRLAAVKRPGGQWRTTDADVDAFMDRCSNIPGKSDWSKAAS